MNYSLTRSHSMAHPYEFKRRSILALEPSLFMVTLMGG